MSRFYRRRPPGPRENLGAALVATGLALGVATVSFYLVRTFLSREALEPLPRPAGKSDSGPPAPDPEGSE
jgi:hypothetical protein